MFTLQCSVFQVDVNLHDALGCWAAVVFQLNILNCILPVAYMPLDSLLMAVVATKNLDIVVGPSKGC